MTGTIKHTTGLPLSVTVHAMRLPECREHAGPFQRLGTCRPEQVSVRDVTHGNHPRVATPVMLWPRTPELGDTSAFLPGKTKAYRAVY